MRITKKYVQARLDILNRALGFTETSWNTVGALSLYDAYGSTGVVRVVNTSGGVSTLKGLGTLREAEIFIDGMIAATELKKES